MKSSRFQCLCAAAFFAMNPTSPQALVDLAKTQVLVPEKIATLRHLIDAFPGDASAETARNQLVTLLIGSNRFEEALQEYQKVHRQPGSGDAIDFRLLEYMLKTGRYQDVLRATSVASGPRKDLPRDLRLLELRVQAFLARGRYDLACDSVDHWLQIYKHDGPEGTRFESDVKSMQYLRRHLRALERLQGPSGKALFTASVPDSLQHWSHRRDVPVFFFKLVPAHPAGQLFQPVLPGRHETDDFFRAEVDELNRGLGYVSGDRFSLAYGGLDTLYVGPGDLDPISSGGHLLTSRVYVHSIPQLYKLAGEAFVVLVDYRAQSEGEAAYMGDGIIHLSASKFEPLVLMHEILHGLGATHNEWITMQAQGYRFDPDDRGLMTFEQGEIRDLGLEEKNRSLLGWPRVADIHYASDKNVSLPVNRPTAVASNPQLLAGLN